MLSAITCFAAADVNELYLIEPLSDQSFIVVQLPKDDYKPIVFELLSENLE
jgi:hypothetical protein